MIPGVDGVALRQDGRRIYFAASDDVIGTMAGPGLTRPASAPCSCRSA
jgi:hypothetical protein